MESKSAIDAFQALAQETRLAALRLLVQAGPSGVAAGVIAERLAVQPSTLSTHLAILERAGLVASRRQQRHIFYSAQFEGLRQLIAFLMEDCCQGRPEICGGLGAAEASAVAEASACGPAACAPAPKVARRLVPVRVTNSKRK